MKSLFVLYGLGLCSLPLWPEAWTHGLSVGWLLAGSVALVLDLRRRRVLRLDSSQAAFSAVLALGFLCRLALLVLGAFAGKFLVLFSVPAFLGGFLAAYLLGELISLPGLARAARQLRSSER